ncbi:hypothetical protein BH10PSE14_BH10PSE14_01670 [soil metagenome]
MFKLGHQIDGDWQEYSHPAVFSVAQTSGGREKVLTTAPGSDAAIFTTLAALLTPPFFLLYVLHTPRGEGLPGRYQSGEIGLEEVEEFLRRHADLLRRDARFDLWLYSVTDQATIIRDRHDLIHAYGPTASFVAALHRLGFAAGAPTIPAPHEHHYHAACDEQSRAVLANDWRYSSLRPEDEQ